MLLLQRVCVFLFGVVGYMLEKLAWGHAIVATTSSSKHCISCLYRRLLCFDPQERLETEGEPVPVRQEG